MAVNRFKLALNNARFPLVSTHAQRAAFVPGLDSAPRTPRAFVGGEESADYNTAQVIYAENVMPTAQGVHSVGYEQIIAPTVNTDFDSIFALRDADENTVLYSPSHGQNYVYDDVVGAWSSDTIASIWAPTVLGTGSDPTTSKVTYAYVDGYTFVCYSRLKSNDVTPVDMSIMVWDSATKSLIPATSLITNIPFTAGTIDGISSSNGYLVMWSGLEIAWAPFNGTSFDYTSYANGAYTGAGRQTPEDVQGPITAIINVSGGFIAFTTRNAIAASYSSQSIIAPWVFREIPDAGGLESYEQATVEGNLGAVVAYTSAGVQKLSLNSAQFVHPEVSDFIAGRNIERFLFDAISLYQGSTTLDFYTKLSAIGNRYIVVSYGTFPGIYSFALVHDIALNRWGRLRMVHRDCFYYNYGIISGDLTYAMLGDVPYDSPDLTTYEATTGFSNALTAAQHGLAFLKADGSVLRANWSDQLMDTQHEAAVVIGRIQLSRSRNVQFNRAEVEGLVDGDIYVQPSYDGRTLGTSITLTTITAAEGFRIAGDMIDCKNFNLVVTGTFDLSTIILEGSPSGSI